MTESKLLVKGTVPPPLDRELTVVGKPLNRRDAAEKVTGQAKYCGRHQAAWHALRQDPPLPASPCQDCEDRCEQGRGASRRYGGADQGKHERLAHILVRGTGDRLSGDASPMKARRSRRLLPTTLPPPERPWSL